MVSWIISLGGRVLCESIIVDLDRKREFFYHCAVGNEPPDDGDKFRGKGFLYRFI